MFAVGKFNSINVDRKEAPIRSVLIGDLSRLLYLLEKLYIRAFLLTHLIIDDLQLLIEQFGMANVKRLMMLMPADCRKTCFFSKRPTDKHMDVLREL